MKNSLLSIGVLNPKDSFDFENNLSNNATSIDKFLESTAGLSDLKDIIYKFVKFLSFLLR